MKPISEFLKRYLREISEYRELPNRLSLGMDPSSRINIIHSLNQNPNFGNPVFLSCLKEQYPIVWVKTCVTESLFTVTDFQIYSSLLTQPLVILTPDLRVENFFFERYSCSTSNVILMEFNYQSVMRVYTKNFSEKESQEAYKSLNNMEAALLQ